MGRRDHDPRPAIEVVGAATPDEPLQRVAVGGGAPGPGGRGPLVVVALVVLIVGLAVSSGGGDEPEAADQASAAREEDREQDREGHRESKQQEGREATTSTTRRRAQTTTTTAPAPVAVLPGADAWVLLLGRGSGGAELLDLDTGFARAVDLGRNVDHWGTVPVAGGAVMIQGGQAVYHPLPEGERVVLGRADQLFAAGPDAVWLTAQDGEVRSFLAELVDLDGTRLAGPLSVDQGWVAGTYRDGLVVLAGGRVYQLGRDGAITPLAVGDVLGGSGGWLVLRTCDDAAVCGIQLLGQGGPRKIDLPDEIRAWQGGLELVVRPDGRRAAALLYGPSTELVWLDLGTGAATTLGGLSYVSGVAWLPGDLGLLVVRQTELSRVHEADGGPVVEELRDVGADRAVVIPR